MKFRSLGVAAIALLLPLAAVACGGEDDNNSGSRPTVEEIKTGLVKLVPGDATAPEVDEVLDCLAKGYYDSDLPNGVVRSLAIDDEAKVDKKNEDKYTKIVEDLTAKCTGVAAE